MKQIFRFLPALIFLPLMVVACKKDTSAPTSENTPGMISGKITDASGHPLAGVKATIEHTVWYNSYVFAVSDNDGAYQTRLPDQPAGDWTAKAQIERSAYGQTYKFDLDPQNNAPFNNSAAAVRNFAWKLSGLRPGNSGYYGAHVDLYAFGTDVQPDQVKIVFTPLEPTLIDGSTAVSFEKNVEDVAGTFMAKDIPIGKYSIKAIYPVKTLLLKNRHSDNGEAAASQEVVFGKNSNLAETEYNIEFWLSE
jgi:hypothetical protein